MTDLDVTVAALIAERDTLAAEGTRLRDRIHAVEALHVRSGVDTYCNECHHEWPCLTRAALADETTGTTSGLPASSDAGLGGES